MTVIAVFVVAVVGISLGLVQLVYYYGENNGLFDLGFIQINYVSDTRYWLLYFPAPVDNKSMYCNSPAVGEDSHIKVFYYISRDELKIMCKWRYNL